MAASASADVLRWVLTALIAVTGAVFSTFGWAHPMPESRVWIDTRPQGMVLTLQLPLNRLEYAFGAPLADAPQQVLPRHAQALSEYLLRHVGVRSGDQGWQVLRPRLSVEGNDTSAELLAVFELRSPPGADARAPTLLYDVITHEVRTHQALVFLRNDWAGGRAGQPPVPLGQLDHAHGSLVLALAPAGTGSALWQLLWDGAWHIAEGTDHLLFLLMLLLVAPLAAVRGRWLEARPAASAWRHTALVVSAFTAGHTLTLVLGSSGLVQVPAAWVEVAVAVALTIVLSALHAWRPLFARAEGWIAMAFGTVHGLAFSASLSGAGLTAWQHGAALLAFNLGVEAMQLSVVALVVPALLMLARADAGTYAMLRRLLGAAGGLLALLWMLERAGVEALAARLPGDGDAWIAALVPAAIWTLACWTQLRSRPTCGAVNTQA